MIHPKNNNKKKKNGPPQTCNRRKEKRNCERLEIGKNNNNKVKNERNKL